MVTFLDFETRSRADLTSVGTWEYSVDPSTEVLCAAYAGEAGEAKVWLPGDPFPKELHAGELHAWNAYFEMCIWRNVMQVRHNWPGRLLKGWHCTMARAAAQGLPRALAQAAQALGLETQKDLEGRRLMLRMCKPNSQGNWVTSQAHLSRLGDYCKTDVLTERAVHLATPDLTPQERMTWLLDLKINHRGIPVDFSLIEAALHVNECYQNDLLLELREICQDQNLSGRTITRLRDKLETWGVYASDLTKATVKRLLKKPTLPPPARRVLEIRSELAKSSTDKYVAFAQRSKSDARVRGSHVYHGALTGRWSGQGVQFQNLYRGKFKSPEELFGAVDDLLTRNYPRIKQKHPDVATTLASCIRPVVKASHGNKLIVSDFSSIEAVTLAWAAGQKDVVKLFAEKLDVYVDMAKSIYPKREIGSAERQLGKIAVLGLGYGMGIERFYETCKDWGVKGVDKELAETVVKIYRKKNYMIGRLWKGVEQAAVETVRDGESRSYRYVRYEFDKETKALRCRLPSGRRITYQQAHLEKRAKAWGNVDELRYYSIGQISRKWEVTSTWGGKLVENIVQAIARDLLCYAMFSLEAKGYPVIFHVHDEVVCEIPKHVATCEEIENIMGVMPRWAADLPLGAKAFETVRYRKD